ncbi:MmcQ/YjbR family DNA-binding protein [Dysgonomonas sp. HDW5A]|uniref:MmcQ/YjbR family DNA-binding protein n=1 Tax=Dysgonomonas sp. HDW5A TaxID=2714926 RepID=UPI00140DC2C9|nr:MmcQ/YjbR family DNA-binding protein [Dysgonomonas sp. HDW5A]QIK59065.1 MmcQ/YjbR family DNA-binding protein [Dysgonomonas sp. HDW5A]
MNIEELREFCLSVKGADESFPFLDDRILVFKVMGKMFAYVNIEPKDALFRVSIKCDPDKSVELREQYEGVMNGQHTKALEWNSICLESDVPDDLIKELILHSVDEVIRKLPKKLQAAYASIEK